MGIGSTYQRAEINEAYERPQDPSVPQEDDIMCYHEAGMKSPNTEEYNYHFCLCTETKFFPLKDFAAVRVSWPLRAATCRPWPEVRRRQCDFQIFGCMIYTDAADADLKVTAGYKL